MLKDIDWKLRKLTSTKNVVVKENEEALAQCLEHILLTRKGEKLFDVNFGSNIEDELKNQSSIVGALALRQMIMNSINNYLPGVMITENNIRIVVKSKTGEYEIYMTYRDQQNVEQSVGFEFLRRK